MDATESADVDTDWDVDRLTATNAPRFSTTRSRR